MELAMSNTAGKLEAEYKALQEKLEKLSEDRAAIDVTRGNSEEKKDAQKQLKSVDCEIKGITDKQEKIEKKLEKIMDGGPTMADVDFADIVEKYDLYYLSKDEVYVSKSRQDQLMIWRRGAFHYASMRFPFKGDLMNFPNQKAFLQYLNANERCKETWCEGIYDTEYDLSVYNLSHRNTVLQAVENGDFHPIYDVLFKSISDGRDDIEAYWKKLIMRKFYDLTKSRDPAPCVTSRGSIGMTLFGQRFMPGLLGKSCVFSGSLQMLTGQFTGHLQGKLWVNIEEAVVERSAHNQLKQILHSPSLTIHPKGLTPFQVKNMVNYSLSTNEPNGPVKLEGTKSDRRFLSYKVDGDLYKWAIKIVGADKMREEVREKFPQFWGADVAKIAKTWIEMNDNHFDDVKQMGAFMHAVLTEYSDWLDVGALDTIITDEYHEFVDSNKTTLQCAGDLIFNNPDFRSIKKSDFYQYAKVWGQNYGTGGLPANNKIKALVVRNWDVEEHKTNGVFYWKKVGQDFTKQICHLYEDDVRLIPSDVPVFKNANIKPLRGI